LATAKLSADLPAVRLLAQEIHHDSYIGICQAQLLEA
jgi:hypothetical protein